MPASPEVIAHTVGLYLRFALSFRSVEERFTECGVRVSYEAVRRWVAKFGLQHVDELRRRKTRRGRTLHLDEMATRVGATCTGCGAPSTSTGRDSTSFLAPVAVPGNPVRLSVVRAPRLLSDSAGRGRGSR